MKKKANQISKIHSMLEISARKRITAGKGDMREGPSEKVILTMRPQG